jgi:hypothetical protein
MQRLLQVRMLAVLISLALIPAATLPFAERIRAEWTRFWEPEPDVEEPVGELIEMSGSVSIQPVDLTRTYRQVWSSPASTSGSDSSSNSSLRFSEAQELGEAAGARQVSLPAVEP